MRILVSVTDKTGLPELGQGLAALNTKIISTGGTAVCLSEANVPVTTVEEITGFPSILGGRVKTLHPLIFGGLLGDPGITAHAADMEQHNILPFDAVVVNLYDLASAIANWRTPIEILESVDIGGHTILRAALKRGIPVICDPVDYPEFLDYCRRRNGDPGNMTAPLSWRIKALDLAAGYDFLWARWERPAAFGTNLCGRMIAELRANPGKFPSCTAFCVELMRRLEA